MSTTVETHYGVRYTCKADGKSSITDYDTDQPTAERDYHRVRDHWPYSAELLTRTVRIGRWRTVQPGGSR